MKTLTLKLVVALALTVVGLSARAQENPSFAISNQSMKILVDDLQSSKLCIVELEEPSCHSGFQQVTPLNSFISKHLAIFPVDRDYGIYRWHFCKFWPKVRELATGSEHHRDLSAFVSEFESCAVCTFTPKAPNQEEINMIESAVANQRAELLKLQGTPAFCK